MAKTIHTPAASARGRRQHRRAPARRLSQRSAGAGALLLVRSGKADGRREIEATNVGWNLLNTNRRVRGGTQRKAKTLCEPLRPPRFNPSHKLYILTAMPTTGFRLLEFELQTACLIVLHREQHRIQWTRCTKIEIPPILWSEYRKIKVMFK